MKSVRAERLRLVSYSMSIGIVPWIMNDISPALQCVTSLSTLKQRIAALLVYLEAYLYVVLTHVGSKLYNYISQLAASLPVLVLCPQVTG